MLFHLVRHLSNPGAFNDVEEQLAHFLAQLLEELVVNLRPSCCPNR
jgi:uncharacterized Fe-S radical SAM superfamily protein PflX